MVCNHNCIAHNSCSPHPDLKMKIHITPGTHADVSRESLIYLFFRLLHTNLFFFSLPQAHSLNDDFPSAFPVHRVQRRTIEAARAMSFCCVHSFGVSPVPMPSLSYHPSVSHFPLWERWGRRTFPLCVLFVFRPTPLSLPPIICCIRTTVSLEPFAFEEDVDSSDDFLIYKLKSSLSPLFRNKQFCHAGHRFTRNPFSLCWSNKQETLSL